MKEWTVAPTKLQTMSYFKEAHTCEISGLDQKQKPHCYMLLLISLVTVFNLTSKGQFRSQLGLIPNALKSELSVTHYVQGRYTPWAICTHLKCPTWVLRL